MLQLADGGMDIRKRDLAPNINFFMNVPVTPEGGLKFDDGVSAPGKYVEMKALRDVMVLIKSMRTRRYASAASVSGSAATSRSLRRGVIRRRRARMRHGAQATQNSSAGSTD